MYSKKSLCADTGSDTCPCMLAGCNDCMECSRLAGKDYCDCNWQGVCIYNEYLQNGSMPVKQRSRELYKVQKKIWYEKDLAVMRIEVPRGFAEKASVPGSCVFAGPAGESTYFEMPISVLRADFEEGTIDIAVKAQGPKSQKLLDEDEVLSVRGIYSNGILGVKRLMRAENRRVLCLTKGVGLAPAANYCRWAGGKVTVDMTVDLEKVNRFFAEDSLSGCHVNDLKYSKLPLEDECFEKYDAIFVSASDYFQENIKAPAEKLIFSNNFTMCCGEGICGACINKDKDGHYHRMCKCREYYTE